jgi:hypothetical protein
MEIQMLSSANKVMENMIKKVGEGIVRSLSEKYGFKLEEGLEYVDLSNVEVKVEENEKSRKMVLPFCGRKEEGKCEGIRLNHGLYTQCTNSKKEGILCMTCLKQTEKNSNGKPTYGYISERVEQGTNYVDPKGKAPVQYGNIMDKLNITREEAEKEANKLGLTIPEEQFAVKKVARGRPKKDTTTIDTSGSDEDVPKKNRRRPKKEKKVVSCNVGEDLIKELVKLGETTVAALTPKPPIVGETPKPPIVGETPKPPTNKGVDNGVSKDIDASPNEGTIVATDSPTDDEDEEELAVTEFKIGGKKYLKASDNTLYDINTHEEIGNWNPKTKEIEQVDSDDD